MLNKSICIRCINKHIHYHDWDDNYEVRWDKGYIFCPNKINRTYTDVIPNNCKYKLEQIMSNNEIE